MSSFGAPGHRGVPLIFAWGIHTGLSYQRAGWKQASRAEVQREGIDRFVKWGANLVDLFPSNKEAYFDEWTVVENSAVPVHTFREHPDFDQENKWTLDDFLAFNRHAHERGFLVTWMIHNWWPAPYAFRARVLWDMCREMGEKTSDVLADGFRHHIDGYAAEGDFIVPEEANDILWPFHPGLYTRESAWGLNYTVANFIQPRGFHLTDGRILMYEREEYMGLAPECWRGFEGIWRGEPVNVGHGRLFVSLQAEGRDTKCQDEGWSIFGGMSSVDILLEQINNYARAKGRGWTSAGTTAIRVINEPLLSPKMKRYMAGICSDPVRCAVAAPVEQTGTDGRYPRVDYPRGTWFVQNNFYRVYAREDQIDVIRDDEAQGNYSNFIWPTSRTILRNFLASSFAADQQRHFCECRPLEEAGARACLQQRVEYRSGRTTMAEFRDFQADADNPCLSLRIRRVFVGDQAVRSATTTLNLEGCELTRQTDQRMEFAHPRHGNLTIGIPANDQIESVRWDPAGRLAIVCGPAASHDFTLVILTDARDDPGLPFKPMVFDLGRGDIEIGLSGVHAARTIRILNPADGPYWVRENGWWQTRGAQPSWHERGTDLLKVILYPDSPTAVRPGGFLEGVVRNAWGAQYTQLLRDVRPSPAGAALTVRVVDISPKLWSPRLEFSRPIAEAKVDGRAWFYFDGPFLFLPNHRQDHSIEVVFGPPTAPCVQCTYASVESTVWDGRVMAVKTALPEWVESIPAGSRFYLAVRHSGRTLDHVEGGLVVRGIPDFDAVEPAAMAGPEGIAALVPRDFNHPPLRGFSRTRGHIIAFVPGGELLLHFKKD
jgi:hypothetical protein